jgi:hypothetical protein
MDKETLLEHRNLWGEEFPQNYGIGLPNLLGHEIEVYEGPLMWLPLILRDPSVCAKRPYTLAFC